MERSKAVVTVILSGAAAIRGATLERSGEGNNDLD